MTRDTESSSVETGLPRRRSTDHFDVGEVFAGGGEMGALMRKVNWSESAVGPVETWPQSLRTAISVCLGSKFPMFVWWGRDLTVFYNDAYAPILGPHKHPRFLGRSAKEQWAEVWSTLGPLTDQVIHAGTATWSEDFHLYPVIRQAFEEDTYFTFSYSPVRDESGKVGGVFCACQETTKRVLGERRLRNLRELGQQTANARTVEDASQLTADVLSANSADLAFSLIYLGDAVGRRTLTLKAATGVALDRRHVPAQMGLDGDTTSLAVNVARALSERKPLVLDAPLEILGPLAQSPWPEPLRRAVILPIASSDQVRPAGVLIVGITPRLPFDEDYQGYLDLVAGQLATAVATAKAHEEEKKRAEALAEIDRAKTAFFSNVSHEFRTPLTLMLGPTEAALASSERALRGEDLEIVHRNELRLLKLVNTLLDFARIQAGRAQARYEPTDLAALTVDLASAFRSAMEHGGLSFDVDCPPLPEPVCVDRDMWEKIVLNLLSNAFKFTFEGAVRVSLRSHGPRIELHVADTGVGISEHELPRAFERFHRIEGARSRSHEGSGIGLALVADLVKLHGGEITVKSVLGKGTTFTVAIPSGTAHLPVDALATDGGDTRTTARAESFVAEALRWLPRPDRDGSAAARVQSAPEMHTDAVPRIVVADDNADMRDYVARLLRPHWRIEAVANGDEALAAVRREPTHLVLSDIMMPVLDGFELVRALRADAATAAIPVILVSARAGEEATAEGLRAGADDYLVKPFAAGALIMRVAAQLSLARARGEARRQVEAERQRLYSLLVEGPAGVALLVGEDLTIATANPACLEIWGKSNAVIGMPLEKALPELAGQGIDDLLHGVLRTGVPFRAQQLPARLERQGAMRDAFFDVTYAPSREADGQISGVFVFAYEVTALVSARAEAEAANRMKDEFLATMSHELRTPLNAILGWATLLRSNPSDEQMRGRGLATIERSAHSQARLIEDVLEVSRIITGKLRLDFTRVEIGAVINGALDVVRPAANSKSITLTARVDASIGSLSGDPDRLQQVVWNLLSNAVKFTATGGKIDVEARRKDSNVEIVVRDSGIGISAEHLDHVFERFRQVDGSTTRKHGGLGLGLAIVRHLVEMHGGAVRAESRGAGEGTTFTVCLPIRAVHVPEPPPELRAEGHAPPVGDAAPRPQQLNGLRILVVDDDEDSRVLIATLLEHAGARVLTADSAAAGFDAVARSVPDLLISDVGMPEEDGYSFMRRIRALPPDRGGTLRAIALTAYAGSGDEHAALDAGFHRHLVKPVIPDVLVDAVQSLSTVPRP